MGVRQPRYSKGEFARRGRAIYQQRVRPQVEQGNRGRIEGTVNENFEAIIRLTLRGVGASA